MTHGLVHERPRIYGDNDGLASEMTARCHQIVVVDKHGLIWIWSIRRLTVLSDTEKEKVSTDITNVSLWKRPYQLNFFDWYATYQC